MAAAHVKANGTETPIFQYLAYQAIHAPLEVPDKYLVNYTSISSKARRTACGMVTCLDFEVQRLVDEYKSLGLWEKYVGLGCDVVIEHVVLTRSATLPPPFHHLSTILTKTTTPLYYSTLRELPLFGVQWHTFSVACARKKTHAQRLICIFCAIPGPLAQSYSSQTTAGRLTWLTVTGLCEV